jgi:hypothetical protein
MGCNPHRLVRHADGIAIGVKQAKAINIIQQEAHEIKASITKIKGLARTHAEEERRSATRREIDRLMTETRSVCRSY